MSDSIDDFAKSRPQRLCHMCGKCCRMSTTPYTYEELTAQVESGEQGAIDFLEIFEPFPTIEAARESNAEIVDNIINGLKETDSYDEKKLTFYKCRHIMDNNLCGIYQNRKRLCDRFPSSPWAVTPPGCGFEGWLFMQREERKQKVRKLKESLLDFDLMLKHSQPPEKVEKINEAIRKTQDIIDFYAKYGSADW